MTIDRIYKSNNDIQWGLCSGCGKKWPTTDLGPYNLCPHCSILRDMDDPRDIYRNDLN